MRKVIKVLLWIVFLLAVAGAVYYIYAYYEDKSLDKLFKALVSIGAAIGALIAVLKEEKPPVNLVFGKEQADKYLVEQIYLRDKTIEALEEELSRKNLPAWEQVVRDFLEKGELQQAIESIDTRTGDEEAAQKHIRKAQLYIANFQLAQAEQHYKQATTIFPSYSNNRALADFYNDLNKFHEAIVYYKECLNLASSPEEKAGVLNNMGNMQSRNNAYPEAVASYQEALTTYRKLAAKNPEAYLPYVATTLNNLGNLYDDQNNHPEAAASYQEALKIRRKLAAQNPEAYLPYVAATLNNLGALYFNQNNHPEAAASFQEALKIQRKLAAKNPEAYLPYVAMTLNNLGNLYDAQNNHPEAAASYQEALKIRKKFAANNPEAYLPDVAITSVNLSIFYLYSIPNKELSLQYAHETIEAVRKCNPTPFTEDILDKANGVIERWKNQK